MGSAQLNFIITKLVVVLEMCFRYEYMVLLTARGLNEVMSVLRW